MKWHPAIVKANFHVYSASLYKLQHNLYTVYVEFGNKEYTEDIEYERWGKPYKMVYH